MQRPETQVVAAMPTAGWEVTHDRHPRERLLPGTWCLSVQSMRPTGQRISQEGASLVFRCQSVEIWRDSHS